MAVKNPKLSKKLFVENFGKYWEEKCEFEAKVYRLISLLGLPLTTAYGVINALLDEPYDYSLDFLIKQAKSGTDIRKLL